MRYKVTICEVLSRTVDVEAASMRDAERVAGRLYGDAAIVLSADDHIGTTITAEEKLAECESGNDGKKFIYIYACVCVFFHNFVTLFQHSLSMLYATCWNSTFIIT